MMCVGFIVMWCNFGAPPADSFCQTYQQVVQAKGDGSIAATSGVKRRVLANELYYRQQCKKGK